MAAAASLFNSTDTEKQTLHRRCSPSAEQFEEQQDRWSTLAEHLIADLAARSSHSIKTWLQGSYKFGTQVRPPRKSEEFDIDLGVYFQWSGKAEDGQHGPTTLKSFVHDSLRAFARANSNEIEEVCAMKPRCSRIRYKNGFHIDVPAYHLDPQKDKRTLAGDQRWETSDPKAIYVWFKDLFGDELRIKARRQIRYLKTWAVLRFQEIKQRPSSILLTVLVADAVTQLQSLGADDDSLEEIVECIIRRLEADWEVPNPVNSDEDLVRLSNDDKATVLDRLKLLLNIAERANECGSELSAADIWQEAFEHMFPMPAATEVIAEDAARNLPATLSMPEIRVTATSRTNRNAVYSGINEIGPIPKDCDIDFQIANANALPKGSQIVWMVRNEGREAELTNDLGHRAQSTGLSASENSAYKGTHFMDCTVRLNGHAVAMRRVPVRISGMEMPKRNPPKRPDWVRLRGRR